MEHNRQPSAEAVRAWATEFVAASAGGALLPPGSPRQQADEEAQMQLFLRFFSRANTSGSGALTFLEFNAGLQSLRKTPLGKRMNGHEFKQVHSVALSTFQKLDVEKNGVVSPAEIRYYIRQRLQQQKKTEHVHHRRKLSVVEAKMQRQRARSPFSEYLKLMLTESNLNNEPPSELDLARLKEASANLEEDFCAAARATGATGATGGKGGGSGAEGGEGAAEPVPLPVSAGTDDRLKGGESGKDEGKDAAVKGEEEDVLPAADVAQTKEAAATPSLPETETENNATTGSGATNVSPTQVRNSLAVLGEIQTGRQEDLEIIEHALDYFESQQRYFHNVADQNAQLKASLRSLAEHRGIHSDRIIIPRIEPVTTAPRSRQEEEAEAAEATIDELQRQLAAARAEIDNLRERALYFESMLGMHLEKAAAASPIPTNGRRGGNRGGLPRKFAAGTPAATSTGNGDTGGKTSSSPTTRRRGKSSARRGTFFGSYGDSHSPTKRMMVRLEKERERARVQQLEKLEQHYTDRRQMVQHREKHAQLQQQLQQQRQQPRRLKEVERVDARLDPHLQAQLDEKAQRDFLRERAAMTRRSPMEIRRAAESKLVAAGATAIDPKHLELSRGNQEREYVRSRARFGHKSLAHFEVL